MTQPIAGYKTVRTQLRRRGYTEERIDALFAAHEDLIDKGARFASNASYVAQQIVDAERQEATQ